MVLTPRSSQSKGEESPGTGQLNTLSKDQEAQLGRAPGRTEGAPTPGLRKRGRK